MKHKKGRKILFVMLIFSIIAMVTSILIQIEESTQNQTLNNVCTATNSDCNAVQNSKQGKLFGIELGIIGLVAFALLTILIVIQFVSPNRFVEYLVLAGAAIAGLMGIYLISIQVFVLHKHCIYCLVVDTSSIIIMSSAIIYLLKRQKK